jgi:transposase
VIGDNLWQHKQKTVRELIENKGCTLLFLPPYRPDFNPIEMSFSKAKSIARKLNIRDVGELILWWQTMPKLMTRNDCKGYFKHAGYYKRK